MKYRKLKGYKYELLEQYSHKNIEIPCFKFVGNEYVKLSCGNLVIKDHYAWDGPSGPTIDTKDFIRGSLVHDALYQLMREGYIDGKYRKYADQLLRDICIADRMPKWRANYVYWAVRTFAGKCASTKSMRKEQVIEI